jgi:outer membrane protein assembly factor BamB
VLCAAAPANAQTNWTSYLGGARHPSYTADAQISKDAARHLSLAWTWHPDAGTIAGQPQSGMFSSPTVYNHRIYVGSYTGVFYALNEATGTVLWRRMIGFQPSLSCGQPLGVVSTASVVAVPNPPPGTGTTPVVYVAGPDGYLYALDGITGAVRWSSLIDLPSTVTNDYFEFSSPTVVGNRIYIGFSSNCDTPFVRGGLAAFDRTTGSRLATYYAVPSGSIGGGVWTSAAATSDAVFATTGSTCPAPAGSGCTAGNQPGDSVSLVRLDPVTLARVAKFTPPAAELNLAGDPDWGSSPIIFNAVLGGTSTRLVGACHKNGFFYALRTSNLSTPVWKRQIGAPSDDGGNACLAAGIYDGTRLFVASNATVIGGTSYQGSLRRVNPATGASIWELGLPANVPGSPALNGAGVIAAGGHDFIPGGLTNVTTLVDADTGSVLATINTGKVFTQPIFADQYLLLTGAYSNTMYAYRAATTPPPDTTPPTTPTNLSATPAQNSLALSWSPSTDNVGVTGYNVYLGGNRLGSPSDTSFSVTGLSCGTSYDIAVEAYDAAGNLSPQAPLTASTSPCPPPALFSDDFESGDLSHWTANLGLVADSSQAHAGVFGARASSGTSGATAWAYQQLPSAQANLDYTLWFRLNSLGQNVVDLLKLRTATGTALLTVFASPTGVLGYQNNVTTLSTYSSTAVSPSVWHKLEVHVVIDGDASQTQTWLDDQPVPDLSKTESLGSTPIGRIQLGENIAGRSYDVAFDDVRVASGS